MSVRDVTTIVLDKLKDPATGLKAKSDALIAAEGLGSLGIRTDFIFGKWSLPGGKLPVATSPNVIVRPRQWRTRQKLHPEPFRPGVVPIQIGYQMFGGDPDLKQESVATVSLAVAQCLDDLREFSEARGGPLLDVDGGIGFDFGDFDEQGTASGFNADVDVRERGIT